MRIRAALGCDLRHAAPAHAVARRLEPRAEPLRLGPVLLRRSRRDGRRVARGLAVLQSQSRGLAPADPLLPGHQPGAVRADGAAGRARHRPTPARPAQHRRLPVRAARRVCRRVGVDAARPRLLLLRAGAADRRQGNGRDATGTHPGPRRRQQSARLRQLAPGTSQRHCRHRRWCDRCGAARHLDAHGRGNRGRRAVRRCGHCHAASA